MEIIGHLIKQYQKATGIQNIDINSRQFLSEFREWLKQRNQIISLYTGLLDNKGVDFKNPSSVEVGKTSLDSIVIPYETTIVTPYSKGFENSKRMVITSDLKVYDTTPVLVKDKKIIELLYNDRFYTYMTQNPYDYQCIKNWENLHNSGKNKIIVGVYGYLYEKDLKEKINLLRNLNQQLTGSHIEDFTVYKDSYCYFVATDPKVKVYEKTLNNVNGKILNR